MSGFENTFDEFSAPAQSFEFVSHAEEGHEQAHHHQEEIYQQQEQEPEQAQEQEQVEQHQQHQHEQFQSQLDTDQYYAQEPPQQQQEDFYSSQPLQQQPKFDGSADFLSAYESGAVLSGFQQEQEEPAPITALHGYFAPDGTYVRPSNIVEVQSKNFDDDPNNPHNQWEAKQNIVVQEADSNERGVKSALTAQAKAELEQFYANRTKRVQQSHENNLVAEQTFIADRDAVVTSNNLWERVTKLADVSTTKPNDTGDLARFRSLLVQLKHTPV
eukprot:c8397_g2_i4.p1 GENE.c8397_g2_i4~~c8397_g2_i4.p1  ORF type:complete len:272 (-),score=77.12 c8397_g2_i4:15-830(-)